MTHRWVSDFFLCLTHTGTAKQFQLVICSEQFHPSCVSYILLNFYVAQRRKCNEKVNRGDDEEKRKTVHMVCLRTERSVSDVCL